MHIPKKYFHDRSVLGLLGANAAFFLLSVITVLLGVSSNENVTSIVAYRETSKIGQIQGANSDLYQFAMFAVVVTVASVLLSLKLYIHRRHLAVGVLALNILLLVMDIIIFSALTTL